MLLGPSGMVFKSKQESRRKGSGLIDQDEVSLSLAGARDGLKIEGGERLPSVINYYVGTDPRHWQSDIPTFAQVRYKSVFSGIDLLFHEKDGGAEFDFQVAPGSDPQQIRLKLDGAYAFSGAIFWLASKAGCGFKSRKRIKYLMVTSAR